MTRWADGNQNVVITARRRARPARASLIVSDMNLPTW
jgi:hypothetical protein